ncbi:MAG: YihY/virulence factor BrkB family protein [Clostridia bacterium]|nr:YihY/virulence factor BrkB family protein [Clostridia bacterium]
MKSHVYGLRAAILCVRRIVSQIAGDKVTVYAAQASFFVIISAVPFLSLLISIAGLVLPSDLPDVLTGLPVPEGFSVLFDTVIDDLRTAPNVPLLSVSAVTTLWSASRGISAIRSGLELVYLAGRSKGFFAHRIKSLVSTLIFIAVITAAVTLMLFGDLVVKWLRIAKISDLIMRLRTPLFTAALCILFTVMYSSTARRSTRVKNGILPHLPGAVFSSVGWTLFSYFYSLYITHFPSASYIYGSLAAVCLIMLWLYFCMIILLLGAEVNKLWFAGQSESV